MRFREILVEIDEEFTEEELDGIIGDVSTHTLLVYLNDDFL